MKKICKICGKEFETSLSRKSICYDDHYHSCPVCGKDVITKDLQHLNSCCSTECSRKLAVQSMKNAHEVWPSSSEASKERRRETNIERYGVDNPAKCEEVKQRISEGLTATFESHGDEIAEKRRQTNIERYGTEYPTQSEEVKLKIAETNQKRYGVDCSLQSKEVRKKSAQTNLQRYGVDNVLKSAEVRDKIAQTNLERYGSEAYAGSKDHRKKYTATMQERYGVDTPLENEAIRDKARSTVKQHLEDEEFKQDLISRRKATMKLRYGDEGMKSDVIQSKRKQTSQDKYGEEHYSKTSEYRKRVKLTSIKHYGVSNPMQNESVKQALSRAMQSRYGVRYASQLNMTDRSKISELHKFQDNPAEFIQSLPENGRTESNIAKLIGVTPSAVSEFIVSHNLQRYVKYVKSNIENEVSEFLASLGLPFSSNCRKLIAPLEVDFYIPDKQIALECNPTSTHQSSVYDSFLGDPKPYNYHLQKTELCESVGIRLIHIFGYEWKYRNEQIKSILKNALVGPSVKYFARNLTVKSVPYVDSAEFLNKHHLQGSTAASIRLGLYNDNSLISLMTFNKVRNTIGSSTNDTDVWELSRFCTMSDASVVGGASKLLKHFVSDVNPKKVISFSDRAHMSGNLYKQLGFTEIRKSSPGYVWVNQKTDAYYNRVSCQKRNLRKLFNDETIDIENKTEKQIMIEHGYVQVFDSGVIRWEYDCDNHV